MNYIEIRGAREHNLKSISVKIPRNNFVLVTGVSGSGKSSLVQNVIANEGQRQFLSQLNTRARQHFGKLGKAELDEIKGMSPVVSLDQIALSSNIRSTVGTLSELYDFLRLLFARYSVSDLDPKKRLSRSHFSFNQAEGACPACKGLGIEEYIDPDSFIEDPAKSVIDGALSLTTPTGYVIYSQVTLDVLATVCEAEGFDLATPWNDLNVRDKEIILYGSSKIKIPFGKHPLESRMKWSGITAKPREEGYYRGMIPIMEEILKRDRNKNILKYTRSRKCKECNGKRLNKKTLSYKWNKQDIAEWSALTVDELRTSTEFLIQESNLHTGEQEIIKTIFERADIIRRLGIDYLGLNRDSTSLSSGEIKRLRLSTLIQNVLTGLVYTLDEPTVGLHPRDHENLLGLMRDVCDLGNTMIVIDHKNIGFDYADYWIELGPKAGYRGGEIIFAGDKNDLKEQLGFIKSPSWAYLNGSSKLYRKQRDIGRKIKGEREEKEWIRINKLDVNNLKATSVSFLAHGLNIICGVSGAGKTSLLTGTLLPLLSGHKINNSESYLDYSGTIEKVIKIDQKPIGRNSRSNPATYTKLFDKIRDLYGKQPEVNSRGWDKSRFSFNVDGGRCPECKGAGANEIGLSYLGSVEILCEKCNGKRFTSETLEIVYDGRNIFEILEMEVDEALEFFKNEKSIFPYLQWLSKLGLGYLKLGQPSSTLSGGEAQRIKLATELVRPAKGHTVYLLDEPASGLHPSDIQVLINALEELINKGHTLVIVEHDPDLVALSDWIVELGPESGKNGGELIFSGNSEDHSFQETPMAKAIKENTERRNASLQILNKGTQVKQSGRRAIELSGVRTNNLKDIDVKIPVGEITAVTGVSGSGKTSLVYDSLYRSAQFYFSQIYSTYVRSLIGGNRPGDFQSAKGLLPSLAIEQKNRHHSSRSTMATLSGIYQVLRLLFSRFAADEDGQRSGMLARQFSFNDKSGACLKCAGIGTVKDVDTKMLISDIDLSIYDGAFAGTRTGKFFTDPDGQYMATLQAVEKNLGKDYSLSWNSLNDEDRDKILFGTGNVEYDVTWNYKRKSVSGSHNFVSVWKGLVNLVNEEYVKRAGTTRQAAIEILMKEVMCPDCHGQRLNPELLKFCLDGGNIADWLNLSVDEFIKKTQAFRKSIFGSHFHQEEIKFINNTLDGINDVLETIANLGMAYIQLSRSVSSLSSGEYQRVRLAAQLGSELSGLLYLIDEPSTALHPSNQEDLWKVFMSICSRGNTIVMVDHNPLFYQNSDTIIELGPGGGQEGGEIISWQHKGSTPGKEFITQYSLPLPKVRKEFKANDSICELKGLTANNLKISRLSIPAGWTCVIGVSGSGKTTLINEIILAYSKSKQKRKLILPGRETAKWLWHHNPLVGLGIFEIVRKDFCSNIDSDLKKIKPDYLLLTRKGGRCEDCQGKGYNIISLDYLGQSKVHCEVCDGTGYKDEARSYLSGGMSFDKFLDHTLQEIMESENNPTIKKILKTACRMGLGYLKAGQKGDSLSAGEKQRLMLVKELCEEDSESVFLFDEPSRGLHQKDSNKFITIIEELVNRGHSLIMVEHNPELIMSADWLIELGPGGGDDGGEIIFEGRPGSLLRNNITPTSKVMRRLSS